MARADRRRAQRAKPAPVTRRSDVVVEDTMFFPRLRRHAKWVFVFLALVFGLGFVGFGVGAGGVGFGDILKGGGGSGVPSISSAQKRIDKNPKDAQAFRDLATAYEAKGDTASAITALESLTQLRPRNVDALRELSGLYLRQASDAQQRAQDAQLRASLTAWFVACETWELTAAQSAVSTYKKIAAAAANKGDKAQAELNLGQIEQQIGDTTTAIAAYKKFLKLAPTDPTAPDVKRLLKQLGAG